MKKLLMALLTTSLITFFSATVFAKKRIMSKEEEIYHLVQENPDIYGGAYFENGEIHVIPLENTPETQTILGTTHFMLDSPKEYSLQQLNDAFMVLRENRDNLNITGYSLNIQNNGLKIYAEEWSEEKESSLKDLTNIERIDFLVDKGVVDESIELDETINDVIDESIELDETNNDEENLPLAISWAKYGYGLEDLSNTDSIGNGLKMTIGAIAKYQGETVVVTTAHGVEVGDRMYLDDYQDGRQDGYIGKVLRRKMKNNKDVCVIGFASSSPVVPVHENREGEEILWSTFPYEGYDAWIDGSINQVPAVFTNQRADFFWNDPVHGDVQWYDNMIEMEYTSSKQTEGGDSGAPIYLVKEGDSLGKYGLVGIYKGRKNVNNEYVLPVGSRWDMIEDDFELQ